MSDLPKQLRIKAGMISMGERIEYRRLKPMVPARKAKPIALPYWHYWLAA